MEKQKITEEMGVHKGWYDEAKKETLQTLPFFLSHLMEDYEHDYGTICHAITAGGIATMSAMNNSEHGGITGFQAGCIMWEFIRHWNHEGNKTGLKIIDFDNMLYPQYNDRFSQVLSKDVWVNIQKQAKLLLDTREKDQVHENVRLHWEHIVSGKVPFGYVVEQEDKD